jgi:hypothetical protein
MNVVQRWRLRADRLAWRLDQPQVLRLALWLVPLLFGLLSLKMGQDRNWDLRNYHLYNPFALLNGKVGVDLAPAQMQTYFNPTIDLLYYGLIKSLPGPVVGFIMGALQGLNFVLLTIIARALLPVTADGARNRLPILLALAGLCGNGFIAQLGSTMGDNLTALAVLGALVLLMRQWPQIRDGAGMGALVAAGLAMGLGVGLKLTVAVYALALCLSLLVLPVRAFLRLRAAWLFGVGVLIGMAVTGGHWYWKMWTLFGNPLFPQFNKLFHGPLAGPISVVDLRFLPRDLLEYALWPIVFILDPLRVSEVKTASPVWAVLYIAAAALLVKVLLRRRAARPVTAHDTGKSDGRLRVAATFFGLSFVIWMVLFSIYRYLVPLELLAPLMLWILLQALLPRLVAGKLTAVLLLLIIASNFPRATSAYVAWDRTSFRADVPVIANPAQSLVLTVHYDTPMGWLVAFFPRDLAFVGLGSNFPASPAYGQRVAAMLAERKGPVYMMMDATGIGLDAGMDDVRRGQALVKEQSLRLAADDVLAQHGLAYDHASCVVRPAWVGAYRYFYQMCRVSPLPA